MNNNVFRFRAPAPEVETNPNPTPKLPPKLHPQVKRRRIIWMLMLIVFIGWGVTQLILQEVRIWEREAILHKRQQELAAMQKTTKQLINQVKQLQDYDYMMEQAHKHGYGKPGEKNVQLENEK